MFTLIFLISYLSFEFIEELVRTRYFESMNAVRNGVFGQIF